MSDDTARNIADGNVAVVTRALTDLESLPDLLSEDLVWHFFGSLDGVATDHVGLENVYANFWGKLFEISEGHFAVEPVNVWAAGDELVVAHVRVTMGADGSTTDAVEVYRLRDGFITEAFDVPATVPAP